MNIRSAKDVIAIAEARGFTVRLNPGPPPMPVLKKPADVDRSEATEALMEALRAWRLEIIEELSKVENLAAAPGETEAKPDKTPADWQAHDKPPVAAPPVVKALADPPAAKAAIEVLHTNGRIEGRDKAPEPGDPAMYFRERGETGWKVIELPKRS